MSFAFATNGDNAENAGSDSPEHCRARLGNGGYRESGAAAVTGLGDDQIATAGRERHFIIYPKRPGCGIRHQKGDVCPNPKNSEASRVWVGGKTTA